MHPFAATINVRTPDYGPDSVPVRIELVTSTVLEGMAHVMHVGSGQLIVVRPWKVSKHTGRPSEPGERAVMVDPAKIAFLEVTA